jgi:hypothetical protein
VSARRINLGALAVTFRSQRRYSPMRMPFNLLAPACLIALAFYIGWALVAR